MHKIIVLLIFITCHAIIVCNGFCLKTNKTLAVCEKPIDYANIPRNIKYLIIKNNCDFQVSNWKNFTHHFPRLVWLKFSPDCAENCLKIDENFPPIIIEGRCLEIIPDSQHREYFNTISNEIASCIGLLIALTVLYAIKFVKTEILQHLRKS